MITTTTSTTLIPGSEFEIRSTNGLKFGKPSRYIVTKRMGLWHKSSSSWVSFDCVDPKQIIKPYDPAGGRQALKAILASGLYGFTPVQDLGSIAN